MRPIHKIKNLRINHMMVGLLLAIPFTACSSDKPASVVSPVVAINLVSVPNGDFENSLEGWTISDSLSLWLT